MPPDTATSTRGCPASHRRSRPSLSCQAPAAPRSEAMRPAPGMASAQELVSGAAQVGNGQAVGARAPARLTAAGEARRRVSGEGPILASGEGQILVVGGVHAGPQHVGNGHAVGAGTFAVVAGVAAIA